MKDTILYVQNNLDDIAAKVASVSEILNSTMSVLNRIDTTGRAGGEQPIAIWISLSGLGAQRADGQTVRDAISAICAAIRACAEYAQRLYEVIRQISRLFADCEQELTHTKPDGGSSGGGSREHVVYANPSPAPSPMGFAAPPIFGTLFGHVVTGWRRILDDIWKTILEWLAVYNRTNPFDDAGLYGGDQGDILTDYKNHGTYKAIIEKNTGREMTVDEFNTYINRMNSEGCGYIAIANAIFAKYRGRPEAFREKFGFEMYKDGDLNYNELFVDLYSSWDNRNTDGSWDPTKDYDPSDDGRLGDYDYWADDTGEGTNIVWRSEISVQYLRDHGIDATSEVHSSTVLTADMYNSMIESGEATQGSVHIRMSGKPAYLRDASGKIVAKYEGGHAMTVTGTTESGMLIVSSWGKTYYVNPSDFCATDGNGNPSGSMGYMNLSIH